MRFALLFPLFAALLFSSCEEDLKLEDYLFKTWDLEWKRCDLYFNTYNTKLHFNETDSVDDGWYKEQGADTVKFQFSIINNKQLQITESSDAKWLGILDFEEFGLKRIVFKREEIDCTNELWKFN